MRSVRKGKLGKRVKRKGEKLLLKSAQCIVHSQKRCTARHFVLWASLHLFAFSVPMPGGSRNIFRMTVGRKPDDKKEYTKKAAGHTGVYVRSFF